MRVVRTAIDRFEGELDYPEPVENGPPITVIDKRADYGKLVLDAEKNAHNLARFDAEVQGDVSPATSVTIRVQAPKGTKVDGAED